MKAKFITTEDGVINTSEIIKIKFEWRSVDDYEGDGDLSYSDKEARCRFADATKQKYERVDGWTAWYDITLTNGEQIRTFLIDEEYFPLEEDLTKYLNNL